MATAIGVVSGVLGIFSFFQGLFPDPEPAAANKFSFRIGLDGAQPPGGGGALGDAGGEIPDIRCFNEVGNFLGLTVNDGNNCGSGSEACNSDVETDNACSYVLFSGNNDAICISWISVRYPGGDQYGSPIGNWAEQCDTQFGTGGPWYWSDVFVQTEERGSEKVQCAWIDADGDLPTTGIQIHWPEFSGNGAPLQDISYYCQNNPAMRFETNPDPTGVIVYTPGRNMFSESPSTRMSQLAPAEKQRRAANDYYKRLRARFVNDTRLVKSKHADQTASKLCEAGKSVGPSFVSYEERQFCEMQTKTLFPFCEDVASGDCWADEQNTVITKGDVISLLSTSIPKVIYNDILQWE